MPGLNGFRIPLRRPAVGYARAGHAESMSESEPATGTSTPERPDVEVVREVGLSRLSTILCDADGNLFPSEEPAFEASTEVLNRLMAELGRPERYEADQLRRTSSGKTFRALATALIEASGASLWRRRARAVGERGAGCGIHTPRAGAAARRRGHLRA